ncbi:amidohydrolase [Egibacter rhizosphaerae]|uniref:Amidohydrolase n=1 Tax=Egibacter rhizosphaerae TaxID=1670831 RepID=A0A411YIV7_9ACTN|nr:amidohydrolase family protein [Egibacter rhizosphaerae]QBI21012.1 amidohydrolase [Egibacter rhizosphaerae]
MVSLPPPLESDADVPAFAAALGVEGLVDLHVHFMPQRVLEKVWAFFDRVEDPGPWPIQYREDEASRLARLRAMGLRAWTALNYPHKPGMAEWLNAYSAELAAAHPEVVHSATFYPEPEADRYVGEALEQGARVFKVHLQVGGYDPRHPCLAPVWRRLEFAGVPVVVHCGSGPQPGAYTGPGPFGEVLAAHPELVAVIAHMGGPEYREFLDLALAYPRVHLDTTMTFTDFMEGTLGSAYPLELRDRLADVPERVVLGTDFPNIPHRYAHQLEALRRLHLGPAWLRAVCHDNPARLLGLAST